MSKFDMARGMSMDSREKEREREIPGKELSDAEILEMRLTLLQQQDMEKLKSNAELMKTLRDLHGLIKDATLSVKQSANEVKSYPAEVINKGTARVEQAVQQCVAASQQASQTYGAATQLVSMVEKQILWWGAWVLFASMLSPTVTAVILLWLMRR